MECRPLTVGRSPNRRFPLESIPRDDSIFPVGYERQYMDIQYLPPPYNNLENDQSGRLSDASDNDYRLSFESFDRPIESSSPNHFLPVSGSGDGISSSPNPLAMVIS